MNDRSRSTTQPLNDLTSGCSAPLRQLSGALCQLFRLTNLCSKFNRRTSSKSNGFGAPSVNSAVSSHTQCEHRFHTERTTRRTFPVRVDCRLSTACCPLLVQTFYERRAHCKASLSRGNWRARLRVRHARHGKRSSAQGLIQHAALIVGAPKCRNSISDAVCARAARGHFIEKAMTRSCGDSVDRFRISRRGPRSHQAGFDTRLPTEMSRGRAWPGDATRRTTRSWDQRGVVDARFAAACRPARLAGRVELLLEKALPRTQGATAAAGLPVRPNSCATLPWSYLQWQPTA